MGEDERLEAHERLVEDLGFERRLPLDPVREDLPDGVAQVVLAAAARGAVDRRLLSEESEDGVELPVVPGEAKAGDVRLEKGAGPPESELPELPRGGAPRLS